MTQELLARMSNSDGTLCRAILSPAAPDPVIAHAPGGTLPLIVIDVGHGYWRGAPGNYEGGKVVHHHGTAYHEHRVVQSIANRMKPLLEAEGFRVQLSQNSDKVPLANRFQARLDVGADDPAKVLHMVLHANSSVSAGTRGFAAMYHPDVPGGAHSKSAQWARALERQFPVLSVADGPTHRTSLIQPDTYASPKRADWNISRGLGNLAAVLVEAGYLTNAADFDGLVSAEGQQQIAQRLTRGTVEAYDAMVREKRVDYARHGAQTPIYLSALRKVVGGETVQEASQPPMAVASSAPALRR
jgi:N-acetylmuramoyl-L-alanine amidase